MDLRNLTDQNADIWRVLDIEAADAAPRAPLPGGAVA
jgi:hypothetical protein